MAVQRPHLRAALEAWRYCFDSAAYIFGDTLGDTKADALLAALKAATTIGLTRSEITHYVFHGHVAGRELARILGLLQDADSRTSREEDADGPGRPGSTLVYPVATCERSERIPVERNSFASFARSQAPSRSCGPRQSRPNERHHPDNADGGETEVFSL